MQMADRRFRLFLSGRISGLRNRRRPLLSSYVLLNFNSPCCLINSLPDQLHSFVHAFVIENLRGKTSEDVGLSVIFGVRELISYVLSVIFNTLKPWFRPSRWECKIRENLMTFLIFIVSLLCNIYFM